MRAVRLRWACRTMVASRVMPTAQKPGSFRQVRKQARGLHANAPVSFPVAYRADSNAVLQLGLHAHHTHTLTKGCLSSLQSGHPSSVYLRYYDMGTANFGQQANALLRKSYAYQKRNTAANCALIFGPIFFCILLTVLQVAINNALSKRDELKCGCQCLRCCKNGQCTSLDNGYCDTFRGYKCEATNQSACGIQFSSAVQSIWCPIEQPSIWPPVIRVPPPRYFAHPFGPYNATPLVYTRDAGPSAKAGIVAGPDVDPSAPVWEPPGQTITGSSGAVPPDAADIAASSMFQLPSLLGLGLPKVAGILKGLTNKDLTVFNGHLLSLLGFQFANARRPPNQYYLDNAFINSATDIDSDTLMLLMPNNTCAQKNLSFAATDSGHINSDGALSGGYSGSSSVSSSQSGLNTYNLTTFLFKFYPELSSIAGSQVNVTEFARNPLLSSIQLACVDVPMWRLPDQEAVDLTFWCGFKNGYPIPPAQCPKTNNTPFGVVESYAASWNYINSSAQGLAMDIRYNLSFPLRQRDQLSRTPALLNLGVRGWLRGLMPFEAREGTELLGLMSMPKQEDKLRLDFSSLLGPLFYTWVLQLLLPTMLQQLVYEKEQRLRMMMKMHGLGDAAYWAVTYVWNLLIYIIHTAVFIAAGSIFRLQYFRRNNYGIQIILYLLFGQLQLAFTFMLSTLFSSARTAVVVGYLYILATGLIGFLLLDNLMDYNYWWLWIVELVPAFSLYRGLYELGTYAFYGVYRNTKGMQWSDLHAYANGITTTWVIMAVEWPIFMVVAWYLEQVISTGNGTPRHPLFFLRWKWQRHARPPMTPETQVADVELPAMKPNAAFQPDTGTVAANAAAGNSVAHVSDHSSSEGNSSAAKCVLDMSQNVHMKAPDVQEEEQRVDRLWVQALAASNQQPDRDGSSSLADDAPILCHHLHKQFPLGFGSDDKQVAVKDLSLAVSAGECFGLLGPNGAGKSTTINMLTGLLQASGGSALVCGHDIRNNMQTVYKLMGVCPQHNLLWDQLTAVEHLRFYGRLKGLIGDELEQAVVQSLKAVNLYNGGVGDKLSGKYSGGMKRRLSVAISFIGAPRVVYLDEPSTGLDPASRRNLWEVVKSSKSGRSIILTTHSMEEAEQLCDRLGIFVEGQLVCIGAPKEITSRYAGFYVFTISVPPQQEEVARAMVLGLSSAAVLTYALGGTLKYELPSREVSLSDVFRAVNQAKAAGLTVIDWGVANATLEEVFIKLAKRLNMARLD